MYRARPNLHSRRGAGARFVNAASGRACFVSTEDGKARPSLTSVRGAHADPLIAYLVIVNHRIVSVGAQAQDLR